MREVGCEATAILTSQSKPSPLHMHPKRADPICPWHLLPFISEYSQSKAETFCTHLAVLGLLLRQDTHRRLRGGVVKARVMREVDIFGKARLHM